MEASSIIPSTSYPPLYTGDQSVNTIPVISKSFSVDKEFTLDLNFGICGDGRLKGTQSKEASWSVSIDTCQIFFTSRLCTIALLIFMEYIYFFKAANISAGRSHIGSFFTNQEQRQVCS